MTSSVEWWGGEQRIPCISSQLEVDVAEPPKELGPHAPIVVLTDLG